MSSPVISVHTLGKCYRIGQRSDPDRGLRHALTGWLATPFKRRQRTDTFWALKDVSFDVQAGEVIGIIGRNGAGKSTLLKILSRITPPTEGEVLLRGRVASLLEVGTGFHFELTGRENIFLNGSILGMTRTEVLKRFDEIVAFSEIERFIDTPVKHYSSGMYVRLAFAVAAHLESDLLLLDEVLAVGDAGFQNKCLGKMGDVARAGRTILFVSHNMQAVSQLTSRCIVMKSGQIHLDAPTDRAITAYLQESHGMDTQPAHYQARTPAVGNRIARACVLTSDHGGLHRWGHPITFEFEILIETACQTLCFSFNVIDALDRPLTHHWVFDSSNPFGREPGLYRLRLDIQKLRLYMGSYTLRTWLCERRGNVVVEALTGICRFEISMVSESRSEYDWQPNACVYLEDGEWSVEHIPP